VPVCTDNMQQRLKLLPCPLSLPSLPLTGEIVKLLHLPPSFTMPTNYSPQTQFGATHLSRVLCCCVHGSAGVFEPPAQHSCWWQLPQVAHADAANAEVGDADCCRLVWQPLPAATATGYHMHTLVYLTSAPSLAVYSN